MKYGYIYDTHNSKKILDMQESLIKEGAIEIVTDIYIPKDFNKIYDNIKILCETYKGFTREEIQTIINERDKGQSLNELAKKYSRTRDEIRKCVLRNDKEWKLEYMQTTINMPPNLIKLLQKIKSGDTILFYNWIQLTYHENIARMICAYCKQHKVTLIPTNDKNDITIGQYRILTYYTR